ncbi:hypothetical protein KCU92_g327, partial [Aureobasidium melanogenum]
LFAIIWLSKRIATWTALAKSLALFSRRNAFTLFEYIENAHGTSAKVKASLPSCVYGILVQLLYDPSQEFVAFGSMAAISLLDQIESRVAAAARRPKMVTVVARGVGSQKNTAALTVLQFSEMTFHFARLKCSSCLNESAYPVDFISTRLSINSARKVAGRASTSCFSTSDEAQPLQIKCLSRLSLCLSDENLENQTRTY